MRPPILDPAVRRFGRDTIEFGRVANLSDAVFAIAMTLLVLNLDAPADAGSIRSHLVDQAPQIVAFALAFALVASVWWSHHKHISRLGHMEPGFIALNLVLLGGVALVPWPTSILGVAATEPAAVVPFISFFVLLLALFLAIVVRSHVAGLWRWPMPPGVYRWVVAGFCANIGLMATAALLAVWIPIPALILAGVTGTAVNVVMTVLGPDRYRHWSA